MGVDELTNKFGRPDLERIGLFIEMPYLIGKKYQFPKPTLLKGLNMLAPGPKVKCGTMDAYFDKEFHRLFEGEKPIKTVRKKGKTAAPFMPVGPSKYHATPGDNFGTFTDHMDAFSNVRKPQPKREKNLKSFITNPGKKGGPGYLNICLSPYPSHLEKLPKAKRKEKKIGNLNGPMKTVVYPKPFFDDNPFQHPDGKIQSTYQRPKETKIEFSPFIPNGPSKTLEGTIDNYPEWKKNRYMSQYEVNKQKREPNVFIPQSRAPKTFYDFSILNLKTDLALNITNKNSYEPNYVKYLLK